MLPKQPSSPPLHSHSMRSESSWKQLLEQGTRLFEIYCTGPERYICHFLISMPIHTYYPLADSFRLGLITFGLLSICRTALRMAVKCSVILKCIMNNNLPLPPSYQQHANPTPAVPHCPLVNLLFYLNRFHCTPLQYTPNFWR